MACKRAALDESSDDSSSDDSQVESLLRQIGSHVRVKRRPRSPARLGLTAGGKWLLAHQLRAHSVGNSQHDSHTVVWRAEVEPDVAGARSSERRKAIVLGPKGGVHLPSLAAQHRLLCATVGGESICLVDVETGRVEMKYKEPGENLWCCAWTTPDFLGGRSNVLAVGGAYLHLINPREKVCFHHLQPHRHGRVMAVQFHPKQPSVVVTASDDKADALAFHHITSPVDTSYRVESRKLLSLSAGGGGVQHMQVSPCGRWVAATCYEKRGTLEGLFLWQTDTEGLQKAISQKRPAGFVTPVLCHGGTVDLSLCGVFSFMASQELLVCSDGAMKVLRFDEVTEKDGPAVKFRCISTLEGPKSEQLSWAWPTHSTESGLWCFADDTGDIWLYDLKGQLAECMPPVAHVKGAGLGVNQVVLTRHRLVAACDNNIIQIWQHQMSEESSSQGLRQHQYNI